MSQRLRLYAAAAAPVIGWAAVSFPQTTVQSVAVVAAGFFAAVFLSPFVPYVLVFVAFGWWVTAAAVLVPPVFGAAGWHGSTLHAAGWLLAAAWWSVTLGPEAAGWAWDAVRRRPKNERSPDETRRAKGAGPLDLDVGHHVKVEWQQLDNGKWKRRTTDTRKPYRLDLSPGRHTLIAGATGAGKGGAVWAAIEGLIPAVESGLVRLVLLDPKGGMELSAAEPFADVVAWGDGPSGEADMVRVLEAEAERLSERTAECRRLGIRKHKAAPGDPLTVIVVDELLALVDDLTDHRLRDRAEAALLRILRQGRAPGWTVVACTQDPSKEALGPKVVRCFPVKICLRVTDTIQVDMVLGQGIRVAHDADASKISTKRPGEAYLWDQDRQEALCIRFRWVPDDRIRGMAAEFAARRREPTVDDVVEPVEVTQETPVEAGGFGVLDAVAAAWPDEDGRPAEKAHLDLLATRAGMSQAEVREALEGAGVPVLRQVKLKRDGAWVNRNGVRRSDLDACRTREEAV